MVILRRGLGFASHSSLLLMMMLPSSFIPLLPLIIGLVYGDPPQPKSRGTYRSIEPAVYGTCIAFTGSIMEITGPERTSLPAVVQNTWSYVVYKDRAETLAIIPSPEGRNQAAWPDDIIIKMSQDTKTVTLILPDKSYTFKWLNSEPTIPQQMNLEAAVEDDPTDRYVGDTPTIRWGTEEQMERGKRDFARLRSKVDLRDDKLI